MAEFGGRCRKAVLGVCVITDKQAIGERGAKCSDQLNGSLDTPEQRWKNKKNMNLFVCSWGVGEDLRGKERKKKRKRKTTEQKPHRYILIASTVHLTIRTRTWARHFCALLPLALVEVAAIIFIIRFLLLRTINV